MLEIKNTIIEKLNTNNPRIARFVTLKGLMDTKCAAYLRWLGTKNAVNRASDYHYLCLAVTDSTAPVNGIDYIHPSVKPAVDYATAVAVKGMAPNGEINFEFVPDNETDEVAARQASDMVSRIVNQQNDPHFVLQHWTMDAMMHKNGMLMVLPVREQITRYVSTTGTLDQLKAFEQQAADGGLTVLRQSRRKKSVDMDTAMKEIQTNLKDMTEEQVQASIDQRMAGLNAYNVTGDEAELVQDTPDQEAVEADMGSTVVTDALNRNTIYEAKYKLTGYTINIQFKNIAQHYWICDPTVTQIKDQPFCGFYDSMTIQEAVEMYPSINDNLDEFREHSEYNQNGAYQAGSVLNNLAIHARDSVPVMGIPVGAATAADPDSRQVTVLTVWDRYDIDGDGELELVEIIFSGSYIISAREVEFIPVANMCPKPLPGNFYGMSVAESVIPMQEYATAAARAEIQLGLLTATPRLGVKPDKLDFEMLQDGEAAIFILDTKFDPATDVYQVPPPSGNLQFLEVAMERIQKDTMSMVGMTQPADVFNPEVMAPGNSGIKLQMALTPNQIIQDNTVRNCADGLKEALWLVWRTLIQYGDDYGVKRLAQMFHPEGKPEFLDYMAWDDMNFCDRKQIHIELALGMMSEENALGRLQIIQKCQADLYATTQQMVQAGTLTPDVYKKVKKPYADTLYVLGVKDCDTYLPSDEEVMAMIKQAEEAAKTREPDPDAKQKLSVAGLNEAKTQQIIAEMKGEDAESQMDYMAIAQGKPKVYS